MTMMMIANKTETVPNTLCMRVCICVYIILYNIFFMLMKQFYIDVFVILHYDSLKDNFYFNNK